MGLGFTWTGHQTIAIHRSDTARRAMPPWTTIEADVDVVCKLHQSIPDVLAVEEIDCVVVGIFHQVIPLKYLHYRGLQDVASTGRQLCLAFICEVTSGFFFQVAEVLFGVAAPVLYWEQGHEWLFGDPVRHQVRITYRISLEPCWKVLRGTNLTRQCKHLYRSSCIGVAIFVTRAG